MLVDVHQHIWSEPLVDALAAREALPFVRRSRGLSTLHLAGEQPYVIDTEAEAAKRRAALVREDGLDRALIALSSPLGIEALPRVEAAQLIDAYAEGVAALPREFAAWGPLVLDGARAADVDRLLRLGFVGVSVPAGAMLDLDALGPLLRRLEELGRPLFVHPGPALGGRSLADAPWWQALTDYVADMQAAWLSFATRGRSSHPRLKVIFAMLAGGAPLLSERLERRGGPAIDLGDRLTWFDSSSYGGFAIEAMANRVGIDQLLYGSDRPVLEPTLTARDAVLRRNGAWLLDQS